MLVVELNSASNSFGKSESRGLGLDILQLVPPVSSDMFGHQRVSGLNDGEAATSDGTTSSGAKGLGLELLDYLESVVNDLLYGKTASHHVSGRAALIDDDQSLPGDALLRVEHAVLLRDLARP